MTPSKPVWTAAGLLLGHGVLYFSLGFLALLLENVIEQPKPHYGPGATWLGLSIRSSFIFGSMVGGVAIVAIWVSIIDNWEKLRSGDLDRAYYPQFNRLTEIKRNRDSVCALLLVFMVLFCYWTWCVYENIVHRVYFYRHGWYWPPRVVLMTILGAWGGVWLADVLHRHTRQVLPVCCVYWFALLLIWVPLGCSATIE